jgi:hypothetical protein
MGEIIKGVLKNSGYLWGLAIIVIGFIIIWYSRPVDFPLAAGFFLIGFGFSFLYHEEHKTILKRIEETVTPISESEEIPPK